MYLSFFKSSSCLIHTNVCTKNTWCQPHILTPRVLLERKVFLFDHLPLHISCNILLSHYLNTTIVFPPRLSMVKISKLNAKTYTKVAISYVEHISGCNQNVSNPLPVEDSYPQIDESPFLDLAGHRQFQMLITML